MEAEVRLDGEDSTTAADGITSSAADEHQPLAAETPSFTSAESIYQAISTYPFETDVEFQAGLSSILGHPDTPATAAELSDKPGLVLKAQSFYFCRKFNIPRIDPNAYKEWREGQNLAVASAATTTTQATGETSTPTKPEGTAAPDITAKREPETAAAATTTATTETTTSTVPLPARAEPPPYPTSFAEIVDLITNNKPIPGIEEIPDTVLDLGSSKRDKAVRRKKPWEKDDDDDDNNNNNAIITDAATLASTIPVTELQTEDTASTIPLDTVQVQAQAQGQIESNIDLSDPTTLSETQKKERKLHHMRLDGRGAVHLLKPDAVPDSGLIAKD